MLKSSAAFLIFSLLLSTPAEASEHDRQVGDVYELALKYQSKGDGNDGNDGNDGSSSSSSGKTTIIEKVISVSKSGFELEFDLPESATEQARVRQWTLPARVFKSLEGSSQLLNQVELENRLEHWLEKANWTREACGQWIFTWNAFYIDCDPQSVMETLRQYEMSTGDLKAGAPYEDEQALAPAVLDEEILNSGEHVLVAKMLVNPDVICRQRADADVVSAQILGEDLKLDNALRKRCGEKISGTIDVTYFSGADGDAARLTRIRNMTTEGTEGNIETETRTVTLERKLIVRGAISNIRGTEK